MMNFLNKYGPILFIILFIGLCIGVSCWAGHENELSQEKFDRDIAEIKANMAARAKEEAEYRKKHYFDPKVVFRKQHIPSKIYIDRHKVGRTWRDRENKTYEEFRVWYVNLNDEKVYMFECPNKQVFESIKLQDRIDSLSYANQYK